MTPKIKKSVILSITVLFFLCPAAAKIYAYNDYTTAIPVGYDKCTNCKTASPTAEVQVSCPDPKCQEAAGTYSFDRYETDAKGTCHWIMKNGYWTLDLSTGVNPKSVWKVTIKNQTECPNAGYFHDVGNGLHNVCCFRNQTVNGSVSLYGLKGSCGGVTINGVQQANCAGCPATATIGTGSIEDSSETSCDGGCPFNIMTADIAYQIPDYLVKFALGQVEGETKPKCFYFVDGLGNFFSLKNIGVSDSFLTKNECCQAGQGTVGLYLDPDYIIQTQKPVSEGGRGFIPAEPFNPFDDIVCEYKVPGDDQIEQYEAKLITTLADGSEKTIKTGYVASPVQEEGYTIYKWSIKGWDAGAMPGIVDETNMNYIVNSPNIRCEITLSDGKTIASRDKPVNLCVHLWGASNADFSIVTMRTETAGKSARWVVERGESNRIDGYQTIEPFAYYKEKFSHYADLKELDDNIIGAIPVTVPKEILSGLDKAAKASSCGKKRLHNIYTKFEIGSKSAGWTFYGARAVIIDEEFTRESPEKNIKVVMHETGHSFCYLWDEYSILAGALLWKVVPFMNANWTNCFSLVNVKNFYPFGKPYDGCTSVLLFRTSKNSLMMNVSKIEKLQYNDWGCGMCMVEILREKRSIETIKKYADFARNNLSGKCISERPGPEDEVIECITGHPAGAKEHCAETKGWHKDCVKECTEDHKCVPAEKSTYCYLKEDYTKIGKCDGQGNCLECIYGFDCAKSKGWNRDCGDCINNKCIVAKDEPCSTDDGHSGKCNSQGKCIVD